MRTLVVWVGRVRVTMGNTNEGLVERGSWWGISRTVGMSFLVAPESVGVALSMVEVGVTCAPVDSERTGTELGVLCVVESSRGAVAAVESSTPVAARRLVMVAGTGADDSVGVGCGCGTTLSRPL